MMFEESFMKIALIIGILTGALCSYLGNFILLRKMTFVSIALSEVAALGVAVGLLLNFSPNISAFLATFLGILFFWYRSKKLTGIHEGVIGLIYAVSAALGIVLIARSPLIEARGIDLISGNLLYCTFKDIINVSIVTIIVALIHALFFKEFIFISFDRETAQTEGLKTSILDFMLLMTIGICISFCMKLTGILFVFSSMIIPGMIALNIFKKIKYIFIGSGFTVIICIVCGLITSYKFDTPTSPTIICFYGLVYILAYSFNRGR